jgi:hypothetical protein
MAKRDGITTRTVVEQDDVFFLATAELEQVVTNLLEFTRTIPPPAFVKPSQVA